MNRIRQNGWKDVSRKTRCFRSRRGSCPPPLRSARETPAGPTGPTADRATAELAEGRIPLNTLLQEPQGEAPRPRCVRQGSSGRAERQRGNSCRGLTVNKDLPAAKMPATDLAASPKQPPTPWHPKAPGNWIAPQTQPIVQQQLNALASQHFAWQGQVWPGQEMRWEIEEDGRHATAEDTEDAPHWNTCLKLTLPGLGCVNAQIQLQGRQLVLAIAVDKPETRTLMQTEAAML